MVEEIRVVMFGKTGVGKSYLGNNILDQEVFPSEVGPQSVTKEAKKGERMIEKDCKLVVVDTPGLFDTTLKDNFKTSKILVSTVKETKPGPHIFIFVLSMFSRYTPEEQAAIEFLKDLFGSHVTDYLIIVFTGKDALDHPKNKKDFKTYIKDADDDLKDLLSHCRGRVVINNRASREEVTRTVDSLLAIIKDVYLQNGKTYYTDELLAEALEKFEEKLRKLEEETHRREKELEEQNKKLEQENKDDKNKMEELRMDIKETQKMYEDERKEKERLHLQAEKAFKRESELAEANGKLEQQINDFSREQKDVRKQFKDLKKDTDEHKAKARIAELELRNQCYKLQEEIKKNNETIKMMTKDKKELQVKYDDTNKLKDLLEKLDKKIDDLKKDNKEKDANIKKMKMELCRLQNTKINNDLPKLTPLQEMLQQKKCTIL